MKICFEEIYNACISDQKSALLALNRNTSMVLDVISAILGNFIPVHNVPPVAYIFRSTVLVFQIVGVLPNIQTKDWKLDFISDALHERVILIGSTCFEKRFKNNNSETQ